MADAIAGGIGAADGSTLDRLLGTAAQPVGVTSASVAIVAEGEHRGTVAMSDPTTGAIDTPVHALPLRLRGG